ncbi:MAG: Acetylspermidine deacetylase; Deacetylases, including yeast histone deacetylase and acetoin utilization protein [uncultured Solirubrobacteraceae bacterium]|uniref:Acetylspermidine deacetylase Deacetylases, including yeast histone deacetylase and acetoin utilization protein n=1 Tax=uncultured Solirubrobacteraceae bacterium TaxID=1162706 RepID=A0A6J4RLB7_9ACTN|nr:MAG: Acetylspermidine deacetylase; Deacetylases, including yeast histone deacetylase and acetoin utilization protein [uncultured Solirubrobacteraceae bacterium]
MTGAAATLLLTHPAGLAHDMGEYHPECPDRLRAVLRALEGEEFAGLARAEAPLATPEQLALAHPAAYVAAILGIRPGPRERVQLDGDTAMNHGSAEAAQRAAGGAVAAVDAVCGGEVRRAFCATRPPGHHAEPSRPMGFCFFSNAVVAARHAQRTHGVGRVAILDFDVHHGNGTQACVEDDPTVFFASSHQWPCYPGTGHPKERGAGNVCNAILPPGADGAAFRAVWRDMLLPAMRAFAPELIVVSAGFDAHADDPLAQLAVREADFAWLTDQVCEAADRLCGGRVVSLLEGGYDLRALADCAAAHVRGLMRGP